MLLLMNRPSVMRGSATATRSVSGAIAGALARRFTDFLDADTSPPDRLLPL